MTNVTVKKDGRDSHYLYMGKLKGTDLDMGTVSTGMGCASLNIIVTELIKLGAKILIRVGTAGGIYGIRVGETAIATGGVRDEGSSNDYAPKEFPAVASFEITSAFQDAA